MRQQQVQQEQREESHAGLQTHAAGEWAHGDSAPIPHVSRGISMQLAQLERRAREAPADQELDGEGEGAGGEPEGDADAAPAPAPAANNTANTNSTGVGASADGGAVKCDDANDPACIQKRKDDGISEEVVVQKEVAAKKKAERTKRKTVFSKIPVFGTLIDKMGLAHPMLAHPIVVSLIVFLCCGACGGGLLFLIMKRKKGLVRPPSEGHMNAAG